MAEHKQDILIGISLYSDIRSHLWGMVNHFARGEAEKKGIRLINRSADLQLEWQINHIKELIAKKIDALIIAANSSEDPELIALMQELLKKGVPVIAMDSNIGNDSFTATIGIDNVRGQQAAANHLFERLGGKGKIAHIQGIPHLQCTHLRTNGLHKAIAEFPNIELIFETFGDFQYPLAYKIMTDFLATQPELDAVIVGNDTSAEGVMDALANAGLTNTVLVTGFDGHDKAINAIRKGKMAVSVKYDAQQMAEMSIDLALRALNGETLAKQHFIDITLITEENLADEMFYYIEIFPDFVGDLSMANRRLEEEIEERKQAQATLKIYAEALEENNEERQQTQLALKAYADELERSNQELERSNQELENFAYIASHDLREPLRKIQIFGDRLQAKYGHLLDKRGKDYIDRMQSSSARMQLFVEDLLAYSRLSTTTQNFQLTNLNHVLQDVLDDIRLQIHESEADIQYDELPNLEVNPTQIRHLFQNLLSNAIKFQQPDATPIIQITSTATQDSLVQIEVIDNGIGFAPEYAERIFGMFQRLHGRSAYKGTGIGLAICRKIVEQHQGTLTATAVKGEGATFTIQLPKTETN